MCQVGASAGFGAPIPSAAARAGGARVLDVHGVPGEGEEPLSSTQNAGGQEGEREIFLKGVVFFLTPVLYS